MQFWNVYFLIKIGLHFMGKLHLEPWLNLGMFFLLLGSLMVETYRPKLQQLIVFVVVSPFAFILMLHELGLVISAELVNQIITLFGFTTDYLIELIKRSIAPKVMWTVLISLLVLRVLNRYIRTTTWVGSALVLICIGLLLPHHDEQAEAQAKLNLHSKQPEIRDGELAAERIALSPKEFEQLKVARNIDSKVRQKDKSNPNESPTQVLSQFFQTQQELVLKGFNPEVKKPDFDLIFLHICSLAWADLKYAKQTHHPLLAQADFLFSNFNSAASYSGPATIRLLRGTCGQTDHDDLYKPVQDNCHLFSRLKQAGFDIEMGLNHNGAFQNFKQDIIKNIGTTAVEPVLYNKVPVGVLAFDGSQIGRDGDYLKTWWKTRTNSNKQAVAYYYNTITLHDGNKLPTRDLNSLESYPIRLENLLNDIQSLVGDIKKSGRKAMLMVVPEHGAGLSGEYGQLAGLRELPTPAITEIPVFGYWIDPNYKRNPQYTYPITVKQPTSYYALNELISRWLALKDSDQTNPPWPSLVQELPATRFVAQQAHITIMENKSNYLIKTPGSDWKPLGAPQQ